MLSVPTEYITLAQVKADLETQGYSWGRVHTDQYHKWKSELPGLVVSYSSLKEFAECPFAYKWELENNVKKDTASLRLGSRVDCLVLTPWAFDKRYPLAEKRVQLKKDGTPYADGRQDPEQKAEWEKDYFQKGIERLSQDELEEVESIADSALTLMEQENLILGKTCTSQLALFARVDEASGVPLAMPVTLCCALDIAPLDGRETLYDLKTTSRPVRSERQLAYTIRDLHYDLQAAVYTACWLAITGQETDFAFLFVETMEGPHMARKVTIPRHAMQQAKDLLTHLLLSRAKAEKEQNFGTCILPATEYNPQNQITI